MRRKIIPIPAKKLKKFPMKTKIYGKVGSTGNKLYIDRTFTFRADDYCKQHPKNISKYTIPALITKMLIRLNSVLMPLESYCLQTNIASHRTQFYSFFEKSWFREEYDYEAIRSI